MGIRGLNKFVEKMFTGWKSDPVRGELVIDGFPLCHALFNDSNSVVSAGGNYVSFADNIKKFFDKLTQNHIKPFVIFDGTNFDSKKKRAHENRVMQQGVTVEKLLNAPDTVRSHEHILPLLSRDVMLRTIRSYLGDDHFYVADGDADVDVASYGISHKCPVLSADSDFYIFPLTHGYIPYSKFNWHDADKAGAIYGEFYYCELFAKQFGIADQRLLALLPAIVGNDTIPPLDQYMSKILPVGKVLVETILHYAADFKTLDDCVNTLQRQKTIDSTIPIQNLHIALEYYFESSQTDYGGSRTMLKCKDGTDLPEFVLHRFRNGTYSKLVIDAVCLQSVCLKIAVEDTSKEWCHLIGLPVRKIIYGILCGSNTTILELQRPDKSSPLCVRALTSITYHGELIPLPTLDSLCSDHEINSAKKILYAALECREKDFKKLSKDYRLLLAISHYWYAHSKIREKTMFLQSLLVFMQEPKKVAITKVLHNTAGSVSVPQIPLASYVHAVSQWQSLYDNVHCLNQLLHNPLPLPEPSDFLECSNLYSYTIAVAQEGVTEVLHQNGLDESAYSAFFDVTCTVKEQPTVAPTANADTGSSRTPNNTSSTSDSAYTCRNRFASLSID